MRHIRLWFILIPGLFIVLSPSVFSQIRWERTNGPYGGTVRVLAVDNNMGIVYASTAGNGVFRSLDQAMTWQPVNTEMENTNVRALTVDSASGILYAGTNVMGIFRSYDQGVSWGQITSSDMSTLIVQAILVIPGGMLLAGTTNGIYRSVDDGATWVPFNAGLANFNVYSLARTHTGAILAGTGGGVFRSFNYGETWTASTNTLAAKTCLSMILHPTLNSIYLGASDGVYQSNDDGITWIPTGLTGNDLNVYALCINPIDGTLYAGTDVNGVFISTDGGTNWTHVSADVPIPNTRSLAIDKSGVVYAGFSGIGVYRSTNGGTNWAEHNNGLTGTSIYSLKHHPIAGLLAGTPYNGLYHSTDYGRNWLHIGNEVRTVTINSIMVHPNGSLFVGTRNGVYLSTDNGDTWTLSNNGIPLDNPRVNMVTMNAAGDMYAQSMSGIYRSSDTGKTWTPISSTLPAGSIYSLAITPTGSLFIVIDTLGIFRSIDNGSTWMHVGTGITTKNLWTLSSIPSTIAMNNLLVGTDIGIFRSTDNGDTWVQVMSGQDINIFEVGPRGIIFCGTSTDGVYISDDNGISWYQTNQDLANIYIFSFGFTPAGLIFAGTYGAGIWRGIPTFPLISTPQKVQFQTVTIGAYDNQSIIVQNVGGEALRIDSMQIRGANQNDFLIMNAASSILLQQDETVTMTLRFTPTMSGIRDANLNIYSNDPTLEIASVPLHGIGLQAPKIAVQDTLSFGTVIAGLSADQSLSIQNTGSADLRIDSMRVQMTVGDASEFKIVSVVYPLIIAGGTNHQVTLRWSPKSAGPREGVLVLYNNDPSQAVAQVIIRGTAIVDNTSPVITNVSVPGVKSSGNSIVITANVSDAGGVRDFYVDYRTGKGPWQRVAFDQGTTPPSATIPAAAVTTDGIDYRIVASDLTGNTTVLNGISADIFTPIMIAAPTDKFSYSTHGGTNQTDYRLFSVPVALSDQKASHFFSGKNSLGTEGTEWRLFRHSKVSVYDEWSTSNDFDILAGHACMLITSKSINISNTIGGVVSLGYLRVPGAKLEPGWNFVGDMFPYQLALSDLKLEPAQDDLSTNSYYYTGSGSQSGWDFGTSVGFKPWEGLAIHVSDTCLLKLKNPDGTLQKNPTLSIDKANSVYAYFQSVESAPGSYSRDENEWVGQIIASDEASIDKITYFGVSPKAAAEHNAYVLFEPPAMPNTVSLFFPNPKSADVSDRLAADIKPSIDNGLTWNLELRAAPHIMVHLEMKNLQNIPGRFGVCLFDPSRSALYDMRQQTLRDIYSGNGVRSLKLIIGERSYIAQITNGLSAVPAEYALAQNYPNPFNPSTLIRYQIPEPGHVTLILYSIIGQEVMKLADSDQSAGYYDVMVNASGLASGIYFYRLNVNGISITKKMAIVR